MEEDKRVIPEERMDVPRYTRVMKEMDMISEDECERVEKVVNIIFNKYGMNFGGRDVIECMLEGYKLMKKNSVFNYQECRQLVKLYVDTVQRNRNMIVKKMEEYMEYDMNRIDMRSMWETQYLLFGDNNMDDEVQYYNNHLFAKENFQMILYNIHDRLMHKALVNKEKNGEYVRLPIRTLVMLGEFTERKYKARFVIGMLTQFIITECINMKEGVRPQHLNVIEQLVPWKLFDMIGECKEIHFPVSFFDYDP